MRKGEFFVNSMKRNFPGMGVMPSLCFGREAGARESLRRVGPAARVRRTMPEQQKQGSGMPDEPRQNGVEYVE